jgi:hypothetical protein
VPGHQCGDDAGQVLGHQYRTANAVQVTYERAGLRQNSFNPNIHENEKKDENSFNFKLKKHAEKSSVSLIPS